MSDTIGPEFQATIAKVERALAEVEHVLIGGQAVFFSGYERFSADVDVGVIVPVRDPCARMARGGFVHKVGARFVDPDTEVEVDVV